MGYALEESSVVLTHMINDIDTSKIEDVPAPQSAVEYYQMTDDADPPLSTLNQELVSPAKSEKITAVAHESDDDGVDILTVKTLRTLLLTIRSDHMEYGEWHHKLADDILCRKGRNSSFE